MYINLIPRPSHTAFFAAVEKSMGKFLPRLQKKLLLYTSLVSPPLPSLPPSPQYRSVQETQHHVYDLVLETREKPLTVMVDGDSDVLIENVIR